MEIEKYLLALLGGGIVIYGLIFLGLPYLLNPFLSDAQRYGIDEFGNPQTPGYTPQKRAGSECDECLQIITPATPRSSD